MALHGQGEVVCVRAKMERSADPKVIAQNFEDCVVIEDIADALEYAKLKNKLVVVAGSIFVVGEAYSALGLEPFHAKVNKGSIRNAE